MYPMIIEDAASARLLGLSGLTDVRPHHRSTNVGYWVRTSAAGCGVATRATRLVAVVGLRELGLGRIEIRAVLAHTASRRVAEKAGASYEGTDRHGIVLHGTPRDAARYSPTRDDLPALLRASGLS
jgi:RimJ/RimL family protein N-acetyltransferase